MSYEVRCACGAAHVVSAADAGSSLGCPCGRDVDVPALHQLRTAAGEDTLSPAFRLEALLLEGKLPGTLHCAGCNSVTDGLIQVSAVCERATSSPDGSGRGVAAQESLGCLAGLLTSLPGPWRERETPEYQPSRNRGQDIAFTLPLRVCPACAPDRRDAVAVRKLLCNVPDYAALLDRFPNATVSRVS